MQSSLINSALNLLFPPRCISCATFVQEHGGICHQCWQKIEFLTDPRCHSCGQPFAYAMAEDTFQCAACMQTPPAFTTHRAALRYNEGCSHMIQRMKYHDRSDMIPQFAQWMARTAETHLNQEDIIIIPVPLHPLRLFKRKYNQAVLLAKALAGKDSQKLLLDGLYRTRLTPPQASLSRKKRLTNMKGVIAVNERQKANIKNRSVLLVDDVMTTGATLNACALALRKAGAKDIFAVTLAHRILDQ